MISSLASSSFVQVATQEALYDMILVERLPEEQKMASGLFLPTKVRVARRL
jgi:hypothetical protein